MPVYCITFELTHNKVFYTGFYQALKKYKYWYKQSKNIWYVKPLKHKAADVRNNLLKHLYPGDKIFVIKVTKGWSGRGYTAAGYAWLRQHLE